MPNYTKLIIKEYEYWRVQLHHNQCYLGRCVLWYKGKGQDLFEISDEAQKEFWDLSRKIATIIKELFNPDRMNYAALGNTTHHLHFHFVPRYLDKRTFEGIEFTDDRWPNMYSPYDKEYETPEHVIDALRETIKKKLIS